MFDCSNRTSYGKPSSFNPDQVSKGMGNTTIRLLTGEKSNSIVKEGSGVKRHSRLATKKKKKKQ
jgi:hypothetical protein